MKFATLSLATLIALGSSAFAADTLAEAFKEGNVSGAIKAHYWDKDIPMGSGGLFTTGVQLSYETSSFNGLKFKSTFQSSSSPFADAEAKTIYQTVGSGEYGPGAVLSEAYLAYTADKTTVQAGRMYLDTPLVASSGNRMIKQAFEAFTIVNNTIENTTLTAAYIQKFQDRTNYAGDIGEFVKFNKDGAYTVAVTTNPTKDLTLTAAYLDKFDIAKVGYLEATYLINMFDLGAQYYYSKAEGQNDTNLIALKAGVTVGAANFHVAYSTVSDNANVDFGLGGAADRSYPGSLIYSPNYDANTDSYQVGASYNITENAFVKVMYTMTDNSINEYNYINLLANYSFKGALKGLSIVALIEDEGGDANKREYRFNASYAF